MIGFIFLYNMDTFFNGSVIALIAVLAGFGIRLAYIKLYKKPRVSLKLKTKNKWIKEKHFRGEDHSDSDQNLNKMHVFFNFIWNFDMMLQNSSKVNAFSIKLLQLNDIKNLQLPNGEISKDLVLDHNKKITFPFTFNKKVRVERQDKDKYFTDLPEEFNDLMILIEFKNKRNITFYRRYSFKDDKTKDCSMSEFELEHWDYI